MIVAKCGKIDNIYCAQGHSRNSAKEVEPTCDNFISGKYTAIEQGLQDWGLKCPDNSKNFSNDVIRCNSLEENKRSRKLVKILWDISTEKVKKNSAFCLVKQKLYDYLTRNNDPRTKNKPHPTRSAYTAAWSSVGITNASAVGQNL